jgi:hypothetical protein
MQRAQPDDRARHAGFRQDPLTCKREAEAQPVVYSRTNAAEHLSCDALWDRVRQGEYQAFRMAQGQSWQWWLQRSAEPAV